MHTHDRWDSGWRYDATIVSVSRTVQQCPRGRCLGIKYLVVGVTQFFPPKAVVKGFIAHAVHTCILLYTWIVVLIFHFCIIQLHSFIFVLYTWIVSSIINSSISFWRRCFFSLIFFRAAKAKYELEQKEMARLQGFIDRFGAQASNINIRHYKHASNVITAPLNTRSH